MWPDVPVLPYQRYRADTEPDSRRNKRAGGSSEKVNVTCTDWLFPIARVVGLYIYTFRCPFDKKNYISFLSSLVSRILGKFWDFCRGKIACYCPQSVVYWLRNDTYTERQTCELWTALVSTPCRVQKIFRLITTTRVPKIPGYDYKMSKCILKNQQ